MHGHCNRDNFAIKFELLVGMAPIQCGPSGHGIEVFERKILRRIFDSIDRNNVPKERVFRGKVVVGIEADGCCDQLMNVSKKQRHFEGCVKTSR